MVPTFFPEPDTELNQTSPHPRGARSRSGVLLCCSVAKSCPTLCDPVGCSRPDFPVLRYLLELAQIHIHWVSEAIQASHPLSPPSLALNLPQHQGLSNESALRIKWPKYWSFSFSISPSMNIQG